MNIFILDNDMTKNASYHTDRHVVKMILEQTQILSACHHIHNSPIKDKIYRLTHANHPCVKWACASSSNYEWLYKMTLALGVEYTHRYGKVHKSIREYKELLKYNPCPNGVMTPFAQAMPDVVKNSNSVTAYRNYYKQFKTHLFSWKHRNVPEWVI